MFKVYFKSSDCSINVHIIKHLVVLFFLKTVINIDCDTLPYACSKNICEWLWYIYLPDPIWWQLYHSFWQVSVGILVTLLTSKDDNCTNRFDKSVSISLLPSWQVRMTAVPIVLTSQCLYPCHPPDKLGWQLYQWFWQVSVNILVTLLTS